MPLPKNEERSQEVRERHLKTVKKYLDSHPEQKQKQSDRIKERYHSDLEFRKETIKRASAHYYKKKEIQKTTTIQKLDEPLVLLFD